MLAALTLAGAALAHTATRYFSVSVEKLAPTGDARDINGVLVLQNRFREDRFLVQIQRAAPMQNGDKVGQDWVSERVEIGAGGRATLPFRAELYSDGKHIVELEILVFNPDGFQIGHQHHNLYFLVRDGKYQVSSYEELYVPARVRIEAPRELAGALAAPTASPQANETSIPLAPEGALTFDDRRLELRQLPRGTGSGLSEKRDPRQIDPKLQERLQRPRPELEPRLKREQIRPLPRPLPSTPVKPVDEDEEKDPDKDGDNRGASLGLQDNDAAREATTKDAPSKFASFASGAARFAAEAFGVPAAQAQPTYTISGKFSYRGLDNALHPGWNWLVEVWWKKGSDNWRKLGAKYISWNGAWSMNVSASGFSGQNIHVFYRAGGYYLMPRNRDDDPYWWSDPEWSGISTNYNVGHRVANLSPSGMLAGLGEAYHSGLLFWWKFYSNNLNPERDDPIRLYYPNTWFNCDDLDWDDNDPDPWSCAWEDRVWLIPAHADQFTIQHELSHQLMDEYWNGDRPDGAGGAHNLYNCYNDGLALSEGFANAAPVWVLSGENANDPQPDGFSIESPPAATCNGDTNELWVAAIFWDLLDRVSDGQDILWFNNAAEVFAHVLGNGKKDGVKEYRSIYRNAASSGHEQYIDDIYDHNTVPVP